MLLRRVYVIYSEIFRDFIPAENLGDAAIGDLKDAGYVAWPRTGVGQLHDLLAGRVRQRSPVDIDPAQLVHAAMPYVVETKQKRKKMSQNISLVPANILSSLRHPMGRPLFGSH